MSDDQDTTGGPPHPGEPDPATDAPPPGDVLLDEDEVARAEIEAAAERAADAKSIGLEAGFGERLVAAITGTSVIVTVLAFVSALVIGAFIIAFSEDSVRQALGYFFAQPQDAFRAAADAVFSAYRALLQGSLGGTTQLSETFVTATPLILTGLAVAVPLRAGCSTSAPRGSSSPAG
jgi:general nucleoside transport system permease protein